MLGRCRDFLDVLVGATSTSRSGPPSTIGVGAHRPPNPASAGAATAVSLDQCRRALNTFRAYLGADRPRQTSPLLGTHANGVAPFRPAVRLLRSPHPTRSLHLNLGLFGFGLCDLLQVNVQHAFLHVRADRLGIDVFR